VWQREGQRQSCSESYDTSPRLSHSWSVTFVEECPNDVLSNALLSLLVRGIIEVACTSLIGRETPFGYSRWLKSKPRARSLLRQSCGCYTVDGDVLAGARVRNLWDSTKNAGDMTRALLGELPRSYLLATGLLRLSDHLASSGGTLTYGDWTRRLSPTRTRRPGSPIARHCERDLLSSVERVHHELCCLWQHTMMMQRRKADRGCLWLVATMAVVRTSTKV